MQEPIIQFVWFRNEVHLFDDNEFIETNTQSRECKVRNNYNRHVPLANQPTNHHPTTIRWQSEGVLILQPMFELLILRN